MSGDATFTTTDVSIELTIPSGKGSFEHTGSFTIQIATGSNTINSTSTKHDASVVTDSETKKKSLQASGLPAAVAGKKYTVKVNYNLNNEPATSLTGNVSAAPNPLTGDKTLTVA